MSLSFLNNIQVAAAAVKASAPKGAGSPLKKERQPTTADIRIWASGAAYPSDALVAEFGLEYQKKDNEDRGFGFDITNAMGMSAQLSGITEDFLLIGAVDRKEAKVDLFGSCAFEASGEPASKVSNQGSVTFGKATLLELLEKVYNVVPNEAGFIDLSFVRSTPIASPNGIFLVPKTVTRGANAGKAAYERRENVTFYPLVPTSTLTEEVPTEKVAISDSAVDPNQLAAEFPKEDVSTTTSASSTEQDVTYDGTLSLEQDERAEPTDFSQPEHDPEEEKAVAVDPFN